MSNGYRETSIYWDSVFSQIPEYNPHVKIGINEIEDGIEWLTCNSKTILDFGCGYGKVLLRCLDKDIEYVCGIDVSLKAIETAENVAKRFRLEDKAKFICGGVDTLKDIEDNSFSSGILFNIIDNLLPKDALEVISEIHRIVAKKGKVLLKLNQYIDQKDREESNMKEISDEFYKENSGIYLWNLKDIKVNEILDPYFDTEQYKEVVISEEHNLMNRMYYLVAK